MDILSLLLLLSVSVSVSVVVVVEEGEEVVGQACRVPHQVAHVSTPLVPAAEHVPSLIVPEPTHVQVSMAGISQMHRTIKKGD